MQIEYHCPYHGEIETLELPDGYYNFEGEVRCPSGASVGGSTGPYIPHLKLDASNVIMVERSR